ncbi:MAG: amino acid decarboxylase, partial [Gammaproteobacteria bacterium]|nr:amino acid decarboxylase [Gammaproteobacteria bacterium]
MDLDALRTELRQLEHKARALQPHQLDRERMLADVGAFAEHCLRATQTGAVYQPPPPDLAEHEAFHIGAAPTPLSEVLNDVERSIIGSGLDTSSSRFFGFIPGGPLYTAALGDYLAAITNRYAGNRFSGPGATRCERALVRWFADAVGYPAAAEGDLTSGGSIANLSAIVTAREAAGLKARDYEKAAVYLTPLTHHCVTKALRIVGMAEAPLRRVALDADYRMDPEALSEAIAADRAAGLNPWLVVGSGGTTDLGTVDPLAAMADIAAREDLWFHVDAAYGGAFALTSTGRERLAGIERSDSLIVDPHKGLFLP